jgi:hypothetical protein
MRETSRMATIILSHWQEHNPQMVAELTRMNLLAPTLSQAEARAADLMHEFLMVRKMDYQPAWELAMRECLAQEKSSTSPSKDLPGTCG